MSEKGFIRKGIDNYVRPYKWAVGLGSGAVLLASAGFAGWYTDAARHGELVTTATDFEETEAEIISFDETFKETRITAAEIRAKGGIEQNKELFGRWKIPGTNSGMGVEFIFQKSLCMKETDLEAVRYSTTGEVVINVPDASVIESCDEIVQDSVKVTNSAGIFSSAGNAIVESTRWANGLPVLGAPSESADSKADVLRNAAMTNTAYEATNACGDSIVSMAVDALELSIKDFYEPGLALAGVSTDKITVNVEGVPFREGLGVEGSSASDHVSSKAREIRSDIGSKSNLDEQRERALGALAEAGFKFETPESGVGECKISDEVKNTKRESSSDPIGASKAAREVDDE